MLRQRLVQRSAARSWYATIVFPAMVFPTGYPSWTVTMSIPPHSLIEVHRDCSLRRPSEGLAANGVHLPDAVGEAHFYAFLALAACLGNSYAQRASFGHGVVGILRQIDEDLLGETFVEGTSGRPA